ncbi:MAG: hypothetical protein C4527_04130 [Candidatus Omnitrophota bacterium]|jgi:virulence-associated protein VagC|nr:MAG: hypothetical protein C4527_04130 [Candidatus Omnitrophota bacterium]
MTQNRRKTDQGSEKSTLQEKVNGASDNESIKIPKNLTLKREEDEVAIKDKQIILEPVDPDAVD